MAILTEKARTAGFLIRDDLYVSREEGDFVAAAATLPGTLVAKTAVQGTAVGSARAGNTGNPTFTAGPVTVAASQTGRYVVRMTSATAFTVTAPNGVQAGTGTLGTAYSTGVSFTLTAGATAAVAGDEFYVVADITEFNYIPYVSGAVGGVLFEGTDTAGTFKRTVIARNAEVQLSGLVLGAVTQSAAIAALNAVGIAVRIH